MSCTAPAEDELHSRKSQHLGREMSCVREIAYGLLRTSWQSTCLRIALSNTMVSYATFLQCINCL